MAAPPRKFLTHPGERLVGCFLVLALLSVGFLSMKNIFKLFEQRVSFYFHIDDGSILKVGHEVTIQGVPAGVVQQVQLLTPDQPRYRDLTEEEIAAGRVIRVDLTVDEAYADLVRRDAVLEVGRGLPPMMPTVLHLRPGREAGRLPDGARLAIELKDGVVGQVLNVVREQVGPSLAVLERTLTTLQDDTLPRLHALVDTVNADLLPPVSGILKQVNEKTLPAANEVVDDVLQSGTSIMGQIADETLPMVNQRLGPLLDNAVTLSTSLAGNTGRLERILADLEDTVAQAPSAAEAGVQALESGNQLLGAAKRLWPISAVLGPPPRKRVTLRALVRPSPYPAPAPD